MSVELNLTIDRGADYGFDLRIVDADAVAIDLGVGTVLEAEIRELPRRILAATFTVAPLAGGSPDGTCVFTLPKEQTLLLTKGKNYDWDFFWTDTAGTRRRPLYGEITLRDNVTHVS